MDSSWWPAVAAVVVLAVVAGLVDSFGRLRRAHRRPPAAERGEEAQSRDAAKDGAGDEAGEGDGDGGGAGGGSGDRSAGI